jgi:hypothetical protein
MSNRHQSAAVVMTAVTLLLSSAAALAQTQFEEEFDDKDKPWQEVAVQMPAAPVVVELLPFYANPTATHTFAIDPKSVSAGSDGVVRYTLVARSQEGASSVSYEGIRCGTFEKKLYAFGQPDGSWSRSRRDQWERISTAGVNLQHAALAADYFCNGKVVAGKANEMVERIRWKRPLSLHDPK